MTELGRVGSVSHSLPFLSFLSRNSDELEEDCFENNTKEILDFQTPLQPNAHLYSYSSTFDLPEFENGYGLDPKTQKYVCLIPNGCGCGHTAIAQAIN